MRKKREIGSGAMGRSNNSRDDVEDYEDPTIGIRPSEAGAIEMSEEVISKFIDIMIVKLRRRKVPFVWISRIFKIPPSTVKLRFHSLPENMRRYYESSELS